MIPTREDLIQLLTKQAQASVAELVTEFGADASAITHVLKSKDDFEQCAPRPEDGHCFAWRLSSLASDPGVRLAAMKHHREVEQPPQVRVRRHAADRAVLPRRSSGNVLIDWLQANPGEWLISQIATARGVSIAAIRSHVQQHRDRITKRRANSIGGALLISLKTA